MRSRQLTVALLVFLLPACATSPRTIAYRTIGGIKISVDGAMGYWANHVVSCQSAPPSAGCDPQKLASQQAAVRAALRSYTDAAAAAAAVMRASASPAPPDLTRAADALLALIASFGANTGVAP